MSSEPSHRRSIAVLVRNLGRDGAPWITDDLIAALLESGLSVDVFHYDLSNAGSARAASWASHANAKLYEAPGTLGNADSKLGRVLGQGLSYARMLLKFGPRLVRHNYDAVLDFTALAFFAPIASVQKLLHPQTWHGAIIWDFYPVQRLQSGISEAGLVNRLWYRIENLSTRRLDCGLVMTEANGDYLKTYHPEATCDLRVIHLWREAASFERSPFPFERYDFEPSDDLVIFGGTLTDGRDLESLLDAASHLATSAPTSLLVCIGGGRALPRLQEVAAERQLDNLRLLDRHPASEYFDLLCHARVGVVTTDPRVASPSFPSKTLDYLWASLPVVCAVRDDNDYGTLVESVFACGRRVSAGDAEELASTVAGILRDPDAAAAMGQRGRHVFESTLTPEHAANEILAAMP